MPGFFVKSNEVKKRQEVPFKKVITVRQKGERDNEG